jgi:hypothetical protein
VILTKSDWHRQRSIVASNAVAICEAYREGASTVQVAKCFGVSQRTVMNILNRNGEGTRPRSEANALRWTEPDFRANQVSKRIGRPKPTLRGDGNPNWRGGSTALLPKIRNLSEYRVWRAAVFTRDDFTCQHCNRRGCKIDADHRIPFSAIVHEHGITTVEAAVACSALWDVDNGRTLCRPCHQDTPSWGHKLSLNASASPRGDESRGKHKGLFSCVTTR